ncbi:MAG: two-component regulator propeller domain-containing protein [Ignavibacteria bacterium]|jgi:ligand-binding sensor domain-containing protein
MKTRFFLISLFFISLTFAQGIGIWQNYTDMKVVNKSFKNGSDFFSATEGGLFKYDSGTKEFKFFTKSEGLSSQILTAIAYSGTNIWLGADDGMIDILDSAGNNTDRIVDIFTSDKSKKQINDILINDGEVYISTDFGISVINENTFAFEETVTKFGDFSSDTKVNSISLLDKIYVATDQGIAVQKDGADNLAYPDSWDTFGSSNFGDTVVNKVVSHLGELFAATDNGLYVFRNSQWEQTALDNEKVKDLYTNGTELFLILPNLLIQYNDGSAETLLQNTSLEFTQIFEVEGSQIYLSTSEGILLFNNGTSESIVPPGPESNRFISLAVDDDGNLWSGSGSDLYGVGFFKFDGTDWTNFNTANNPELPSNAYHIIYAADDNSIYIGNWGRGITKYKENSFEIFNSFNTDLQGIPNDPDFVVINGIDEDSEGNIWVANYWTINAKPLSVLTPDNELYHFSVTSPSIASDDEISFMAVDRYNNKWFAVTYGTTGLYYFNENGTFDDASDDNSGRITTNNGLNNNTISAIAIDQRSNLWVGSSQGVNIINILSEDDFYVNSTSAIPILQQTINCITVDPINQKWVGTENGVFVMTEDGTEIVEQYTSSNSPLPSNDIKSIAFDEDKGIAYIGTNFGLTSVTTTSVKPQDSFTELFVYPNPFNLNNGSDAELIIDGLIKSSSIKILTVSGDLVRDIETYEGRVAVWDGRNNNGELVSTGIYIIIAYDEDATNVAKSKVAVFNR